MALLFFLLFKTNGLIAKQARVISCESSLPRIIRVPPGDVMVIEFPERPNESLPGKTDFDFKFIGNDLAIKSLRPGVSTNLFVYLNKRRCSFKIIATSENSDDIVQVEYPKETLIEVKYVN